MKSLSLIRPDDWHIHLRDDDRLPRTVADAARYFGRVLVMPNLVPPVVNVQQARDYRDRILACLTLLGLPESSLDPQMTLYLTDETSANTVVAATQSGFVKAFKLYPAGATTNSAAGVTQVRKLYPIFEQMQESDMVLSIHGEVTDDDIDVFDREAVFIDRELADIVKTFPDLRIALEHITTKEAVDFVMDHAGQQAPRLVATITAHHLLYNRNHMLAQQMKPIYYCLPVLKRDRHQQALVQAATSGNPAFFLGTDSAPHPQQAKESACGCAAGCYTAHAAIELYAEVFANEGKLAQLEGFASLYGADFYRVPRNQDIIQLEQRSWQVPLTLPFAAGSELADSDKAQVHNSENCLVPIRAGEMISWQVTAGARHPCDTLPD